MRDRSGWLVVLVLLGCGGSSAKPDAPRDTASADGARDAATTAHVQASWSFGTVAGSAVDCPDDATVATLVSQPISSFQDLDETLSDVGNPIDDTGMCSDGSIVSSPLASGLYREVLTFGASAVAFTYQSLPENIELGSADLAYAPAPIAVDGGHFFVNWQIDETGGAPGDCDENGVASVLFTIGDGSGSAGTEFQEYPCVGEEACAPNTPCDSNFGGGFTGALALGTYNIQLFALDGNGREIGSGSETNVQLTVGANDVTDLGTAVVTVPP